MNAGIIERPFIGGHPEKYDPYWWTNYKFMWPGQGNDVFSYANIKPGKMRFPSSSGMFFDGGFDAGGPLARRPTGNDRTGENVTCYIPGSSYGGDVVYPPATYGGMGFFLEDFQNRHGREISLSFWDGHGERFSAAETSRQVNRKITRGVKIGNRWLVEESESPRFCPR